MRPLDSWSHLQDLDLADPDPSDPSPIHLLIGADLYGAILRNDLRQGPLGTPTAQRTIFGWIVYGPTGARSTHGAAPVLNCIATDDTDRLLERFWETEEIRARPALSEADEKCERHFRETHSRDSEGRYVVRLPFKDGPPIDIGESFKSASLLYRKLESRLRAKPELTREYHAFLREYEALGHMELVRDAPHAPGQRVYLPHHPVVRESSSTTKIRVVFNASHKTSNGTTLNNHLFVGPRLQRELRDVLIRWRRFRFVYCADVEKMFRQIRVERTDCNYQFILWRPHEHAPIQSYRLLTVTYGSACAPFLAMRCLEQLCEDEGISFPEAVAILEELRYVDETFFGADHLGQLRKLRDQLNGLMARGGFHLRKWAANSAELLSDISSDANEKALDRPFDEGDELKVLGITWQPHSDIFRYKVTATDSSARTKRAVLSHIARLYDPLDWVTPVIIVAKIFMQELWIKRFEWDAELPDDLLRRWNAYRDGLARLAEVRIPRWLSMSEGTKTEIHGFADASSRAYAAVIYL
ncbi:uncharacterized protein [Temnothorax nylanderi]|uniref:uncharacterized protein n=1 Tax=Temnothorax nylanderi TaxID=102681 RepID=UPI003A886B00